MKTPHILTTAIATLTCLLPLAASASTWTGAGTNQNVSNPANWGGVAPVSDLNSGFLVFPNSPVIYPFFDTVGFATSAVSFSGGAPSYILSVNALTIGSGGIANLGLNIQTFNNNIILGTSTTTFLAQNGPLAFAATVFLGTRALSVAGNSNTSFRDFAGTGSVTKTDSGIMTWAPPVTTSADIVVNGGTVNTVADGSTDVLDGTASIAVNGTSTLNINENMVLDGGAQLTRQTGATVKIANVKRLTIQGGSDFIVTGNYTTNAPGATIIVAGAGSTMQTSGGSLSVSSSGTLFVESGGSVSAGGGLDILSELYTVVAVDGTGSSLSAGGTSYLGALFNGAQVTFSNDATGSFAAVVVSGKDGLFRVIAGADVTASGNLRLDRGSDILVAGAGSTWTQTGATVTTLGEASGDPTNLSVGIGGVFTSGTGSVTLNATTTINIDSGTLDLRGPLVRNGGALNFTSGSLSIVDNFTVGLDGLLGADVTFDTTRRFTTTATTTIGAFHTLTLNGATFSTGALVNNGTLAFNSGTIAITGAGGFNIGSGALGSIVTLGTGANLQVTNAATVASSASLTLDGGTFTAGSLANSGMLRVNSGSVNLTTVTNAGGALLRVNGGSFSAFDIVNNGTIDHADGTFFLTGTLTNNASGRLFVGGLLLSPDAIPLPNFGAITNAGRITLQGGLGLISGAAAITNTGVITGDGTIAKPVTNSAGGQLRAETGKTLVFTGAVAANAGTFSLLGGTLEFTSAITNGATGFITGDGTLITAALTNNGTLALSGTTRIFGDVTNAAGARIVTSGGATTTFFDDVIHNGAEIRTSAGGASVFFGAVSGAGPYTGTGTVYFEGDLRPGNSPASVLYEGDLVLGGGATLTLELGGLLLGGQYDHLNIGGTFTEDGALDVVLYNNFAPHFGDTFDLFDAGALAGNFDDINLPALPGDLNWDDSQLASTGTLRVVPEPSAALLAAIGALVAATPRRRKCPRRLVARPGTGGEGAAYTSCDGGVAATRCALALPGLRRRKAQGAATFLSPTEPTREAPHFPRAGVNKI